jgi:D-tyrosyl-tRNA(Tyr) deacylase
VAGSIAEPGLVVLVGVTHADTQRVAETLAAKIWQLRILEGERSAAGLSARVETGVFGANMQVSLVNDGPVTLILEA